MGNSRSKSKSRDRSGDEIDYKFAGNIERLKNDVPEMVNLHYGLLDTLVGQGLLTRQQVVIDFIA